MRDSISFRRVEFRSSEVNKKFLVRVGVSILLFLSVTLLNEVHTSLKQQNSQGVLETSLKNKKDGGRNAENFFLAFKGVFWKFSSRWLSLTDSAQIQRKTKKPVFITFLGLKDCGGFKGRREMSQYQVVPFAISANFGCNLSAKVYAGYFLVGF